MHREKKINIKNFEIIDQVKNSNYPELHSTALYPEWYLIAGPSVEEKLIRDFKQITLNINPELSVVKQTHIQGFVEPLSMEPLIELLTTLEIAPFSNSN